MFSWQLISCFYGTIIAGKSVLIRLCQQQQLLMIYIRTAIIVEIYNSQQLLLRYITHGNYCRFIMYIYIYTTILPWSCTDGRYFYHISGTALFSGTNSCFFGAIVIFL